jgi:hypothetical protein
MLLSRYGNGCIPSWNEKGAEGCHGKLVRDVLYVDGQIYNENMDSVPQTSGKRNQYNNCTITPTTQAQLGHTRRWHWYTK